MNKGKKWINENENKYENENKWEKIYRKWNEKMKKINEWMNKWTVPKPRW